MSPIARSVCVFCGSRPGADPEYVTAAQNFGTALAASGMRLVYGAGDVGIMGEVARAAHKAGGETFGVIPKHLINRERGKYDLSTFVVTENMHERKKVMHMNSDAIVMLPGGAGSLDEFFEVLTWRQLALHDKPIYVVNVKGMWTPLLDLLDHIIAQGFAEPNIRNFVTVVDDIPTLMQTMSEDLA